MQCLKFFVPLYALNDHFSLSMFRAFILMLGSLANYVSYITNDSFLNAIKKMVASVNRCEIFSHVQGTGCRSYLNVAHARLTPSDKDTVSLFVGCYV
jgi:hypothetical protein